MHEQQRQVPQVRQPGLDRFHTQSGTHLRNNGREALRPHLGEIQRPRSSVAETCQVDTVKIHVVVRNDLPEHSVEAARHLGRPPVLSRLRIQNEIFRLRDNFLSRVYPVNREPSASAQIYEQRRWTICAVRQWDAEKVGNFRIRTCCPHSFIDRSKLAGYRLRCNRTLALVHRRELERNRPPSTILPTIFSLACCCSL